MDINQSPDQYAPDKLLVFFKHSRFTLALLVSLGLHVVVIGGTSAGYITDRWIYPEGAAQRKAKAQALQQAAAASNEQARALAAAATNTASGTVSNAPGQTAGATNSPGRSTSNAPAATSAKTNDLSLTNTAIMKQITEVAKPDEIPPAPDDLGLSIKDTNPQ